MKKQSNDQSFSFGEFHLDAHRRTLLRQGAPVALQPKAFDLLLALVRSHGSVVSRSDLYKQVWPGVTVEDGNLSFHVSAIRRVLGQSPEGETYIVTVPGRGYQFAAAVRSGSAGGEPTALPGPIQLDQQADGPFLRPAAALVEPVSSQASGDLPVFERWGTVSGNRSTGLPAQTTPLIGREVEVEAITDLICREGKRLLTLTGPGGSGKTALARRVVSEIASRFKHGVSSVTLDTLQNPDLVPAALAQALDLRSEGSESTSQLVTRYLSRKEVVLFFDNFEHLLPAALFLVELLEHCPELTILITSRIVLRVLAEQEYFVLPLAAPNRRDWRNLEALRRYPAVELFVQRGRLVAPAFALNEGNAAAIGEICARLDGLPLAIELAASRLKLMDPPEILDILTKRGVGALTGGRRDAPSRQQTVWSTIAWSYDLLAEDEKRLFERLSVFVGGFTIDAAEAVCADLEGRSLDVLSGLGSLADNSVIRRVEKKKESEQSRFTMLETLREYGLERLEAGGEADAQRRAHAQWILRLAEDQEPKIASPGVAEALDLLEREIGNIRAALIWSREEREIEIGLRIAASLDMFWAIRGFLPEGRKWLDGFLTKRDGGSPQTRVKALHAATHAARDLGMHEDACRYGAEAVSISKENGWRAELASVNALLGHSHLFAGNHQEAERLFEESLKEMGPDGDTLLLCGVLSSLSNMAHHRGNDVRSLELGNRAISLLDELGARFQAAAIRNNTAVTLTQRGELREAAIRFREALIVFAEAVDHRGILAVVSSMGLLGSKRKEYKVAARLWGVYEGHSHFQRGYKYQDEERESQEALAELRLALGPTAFDAAWREGSAMSVNDAIAYCLELCERWLADPA